MLAYEMAHQYPSEQLTSSDLWQERLQAIHHLGQTSLYLASICEEFSLAQQSGNIPQELWELNTKAQVDNINATEWLMNINIRIHEGEL